MWVGLGSVEGGFRVYLGLVSDLFREWFGNT
jgi:hypothetical protein